MKTNLLWAIPIAASMLLVPLELFAGARTEVVEKSAEPITLKWLSHRPPSQTGSTTQQFIEQRFGVKLDIWQFASTGGAEWAQELNLKLAAGQVPDLFYLWSNSDVDLYAQQGVLAQIPKEEIQQKMPYYSKSMTEAEPGLWNTGMSQGKRYSIPLYFPLGNDPRQPAYNKAWLTKAGFTKAPETLAEVEKVLYYFANQDPDGNGKKDTFGYSSVFNQTPVVAFQSVFGAYGVLPFQWKEIDGKVVFGMTTERVREAFRTLARWYKDGVIDKEFVVTTWAKYQNDFTQGRVGMFDAQRWDNLFPGRPINKAFADAGNDIVVGGAIKGPYGEGVLHAWGYYNNFLGFGAQLDKEKAKRDKLFEILDALSNNDEVYLRTQFGILGEHYDMVDGTPSFKSDWSDPTKQASLLGLGDFFNPFRNKTSKMVKYMFTSAQLAYRNEVVKAGGYKTSADKSWEVVVTEMKNYPDLDKIANEYFVKFITGSVDLDKGFDDFVAYWKKSGGEVVTNAMNTAFKAIK